MKESIIYAMMQKNGWTEESKFTNPLDWDPERDDSQISMIKEDVNFILDSFLEHLETESDDEEELEEEDESIFDEYGHLRRRQTNTTSASIFVFMDAGTGVPRYVSDVREWLARVDRLGVPNDTEIEGSLYLSFDIDEPYTERIECGGCGTKDILLTVHSCEETPC